jgi:hypothetical protein
MEAYSAFDDRRARLLALMLVGDTAAAGAARHRKPALCEPDERLGLRKTTVAVALLPSLMLWALICFALTRLISNWP